MTHLGTIIVHVAEIGPATEFWTKVLSGQYKLVYSDHNSSTFHPESGQGIAVQLNTDDQTHFDLNTESDDERSAEVERLLSLGARRVDWPHRSDVTVLADPSGLRFCVC